MTVSIQSKPIANPLLANLADVALIDARTCVTTGQMSVSWWHAEVAAGRAPQPAVRLPRCTRWRLSEVRQFWQDFAQQGGDPEAGIAVVEKATKASRAAQAKRASLATAGGQ